MSLLTSRRRIKMDVHNLPLEIWLHIGTHVIQQRQLTLRSLSESCRSFHAWFTPLLFSSLRFRSFEEITSPAFVDLAPTRNLRHVESLKIQAGYDYARGRPPKEEAALYARFNRHLMRLLENMPSLVSFTLGMPGPWKTFQEEEDGNSFVPLFSDVVQTLQLRCTKLQHLTICVGDIPSLEIEHDDSLCFDWHRDIHRLVKFGNLRSLTLVGEFVCPASADAVVSTLLASPGFCDLSLDDNDLHLSGICTQYADSGGEPLSLKRLRYRAVPGHPNDAWPVLHKLTDLQKLEWMDMDIYRSWNGPDDGLARREPIYQALADPAQFSSLRRLSVDCLDDALFTTIQRVGQSLEFPPFFLSELFFQGVDCQGAVKGGFNIHPKKREYWPTRFALGLNARPESTTEFRRGLTHEISTWKGLQLLHLCLDMDRSHLVELTDSLGTSLRELYITDDFHSYGEGSFAEDDEYGSELDLAERICAKSRIAYLVLYSDYFRVVRQVGEEVRLEYIDLYSSEAEEAEIFMMYRERMEI
ncbi:hypothetical protein BJX63DRAFT_406681 [Aspergillus granulosus]|uniref:F-box domain-containing protein n=1 Tax=Aspergillus granulosus TaxID=176169 RepID=A0ABR4H128_9EURO